MSTISYITQIQFGYDSLGLLKQECARVGIRRPLVVTDAGVRRAGIVARVLAQLDGASENDVYDGTPPNPNERAVRAAVEQFRAGGHDGIVAVGGGSSIDLAKGVAVCATHDGPLRSFAAIEGGASRITAATASVIAVPTTAGTGSEVGRGAILILDDGRKVGILSPHVVPKAAICDPALTLDLPAALTAATGMDAIAHCIETFLSPAFNPPADGIALDGLRRAWAFIERATNEPHDREARLNMMSASMQGALAFQKGLGCVHSLSHSLGGINPALHHGTLNAVFLPAVLRFNASAASVTDERKMARLAQSMALGPSESPDEAIARMNARLGLARGLAELGVERALFPRIVTGALADHSHKSNPRDASPDDYLALLDASM
ncbi:4-hydroxybutyrate dehydrogenase [Burkholderia sp. WAC0059]|uniref:iron-containing alcohol dehydrogenase n=1 Tax=Burkholderia sp. WAC0059 TaxID=2066022 RepID=UPI000C7F016C|nr:iron-containing alcohol dehydrogenase [Burkholderia sp. WAC0059]PLZ04352.1 4-hydroxybutyrate dehydrogenase [Burkholderia sp. WAC0059]